MTFMGVDARENGKKWIGNQKITNEWTATHTSMQQQQDVHILFQTKFSNLIICGLWDFIVFSSRVHR